MAWTTKQITDLNRMNRAAQNVGLGTVLADLAVADLSDTAALVSATAGVATASKAAILGANKNLDTLVIADSGLKLGSGAGTAITKTAAQINSLVVGVAAGYKVAYGTATIGAASEDIVTGLTTVVGFTVSMVGDPSLTHMFSSATAGDQAGAPAAGSLRIKSWKPTGTGDVSPIAATSPFGSVSWIAFGT